MWSWKSWKKPSWKKHNLNADNWFFFFLVIKTEISSCFLQDLLYSICESRWTYEEFFSRYRVLLRGPQIQDQDQVQAACRQALPQLIPDPDQYCFGKTKVFFRAGQVALMERLRAERLRVAAVTIQSQIRGWLARIRYTRMLWAAVTIQRYSRGALARRWAQNDCLCLIPIFYGAIYAISWFWRENNYMSFPESFAYGKRLNMCIGVFYTYKWFIQYSNLSIIQA